MNAASIAAMTTGSVTCGATARASWLGASTALRDRWRANVTPAETAGNGIRPQSANLAVDGLGD